MPKRSFTPWRRDRRIAALLLFVVPPLCALSAYVLPESRLYALLVAVLAAAVGWRYRQRAAARRHGQQFESTHGPRARSALSRAGFEVEIGRMSRVGDIDLIASRGPWSATVEIKSFGFWRNRLRDRARQQRARRQARAQRGVARADMAVIWLPKAKPNWLSRLVDWLLPERNPVVVRGGSQALVRALARRAPAHPGKR